MRHHDDVRVPRWRLATRADLPARSERFVRACVVLWMCCGKCHKYQRNISWEDGVRLYCKDAQGLESHSANVQARCASPAEGAPTPRRSSRRPRWWVGRAPPASEDRPRVLGCRGGGLSYCATSWRRERCTTRMCCFWCGLQPLATARQAVLEISLNDTSVHSRGRDQGPGTVCFQELRVRLGACVHYGEFHASRATGRRSRWGPHR